MISSGIYAAVVAASFLIVVSAIFYRRRRNGSEHDSDSQPSDFDQETTGSPRRGEEN